MSTPPLYDTILPALRQHLPLRLPSQVNNLALLVAGAVQTQSCQVAALARALPLPTTQAAKQQRIRRLLDNPRITQTTHYQPLAVATLRSLRGQAVAVLIDRVVLRDDYNILVVSVGFRRRSIPLAWQVLDRLGNSTAQQQIALVQTALARLPPDVRVTLHGDAEFRSRTLFSWVREQGYHAMLGVSKATYVYPTPDGSAAGRSLETVYGDRRTPLYLNAVYLGREEPLGPVNLLLWWAADADGEKLRCVLTDLPANGQTGRRGRQRMWIETLFRDWQSGGFHLEASGLQHAARLERLLLVLVVAYVLFVSVGRWVVKRGWRRQIDDGGARQWHYSLFQLGVGWLEHQQARGQPFPIMLCLYC